MNKTDPGIDFENFVLGEELAKFEGLNSVGWNLILRLYTEPPVTTSGILKPDSVHDEQQYSGCVGLVISLGKGAYKDKRYKDTGPWCKVGDWVVFSRHSGFKKKYNGITVFFLREDGIDGHTDDPRKIT